MTNQTVYLQLAAADKIIYTILSGSTHEDLIKKMCQDYHEGWNTIKK